MSQNLLHFHSFKSDISKVDRPKKFTFPFYYEPHNLARIATNELQEYLKLQTDFKHNFGLNSNEDGLPIGKMFGVLVVENGKQELGYLAAFSGKLSDESLPQKFVPPIFNILDKEGFYKKGEREQHQLSLKISEIENNIDYHNKYKLLNDKIAFVEKDLKSQRDKMKLAKKDRRSRKTNALKELNKEELELFNEKLKQESLNDQFLYRELVEYRNEELLKLKNDFNVYEDQLKELKSKRKNKSIKLQQKIFDQYQFLNQYKEKKDLHEIFHDQVIPGGAGECSAPKLLQYAFAHQLKPIAMAEFWWGKSPDSEIRKHKYFYPACRGRCKPILKHMLQDIEMDENPITQQLIQPEKIKIIYEDEAIFIINKPIELLSVPGKTISDSVQTRMGNLYPNLQGPLIIHRLDMSTSGIMILAKNKEVHKAIQSQFIKREVKKRYVALLDGIIEENEGEINLPLRVDLTDRPRQMVCNKFGKNALTKWKVINKINNKTRIHFFPKTGRTHQLRVHASHPLGLNTAIVGDDLYGKVENRLHLHAEYISFKHPLTKKEISFEVQADF